MVPFIEGALVVPGVVGATVPETVPFVIDSVPSKVPLVEGALVAPATDGEAVLLLDGALVAPGIVGTLV